MYSKFTESAWQYYFGCFNWNLLALLCFFGGGAWFAHFRCYLVRPFSSFLCFFVNKFKRKKKRKISKIILNSINVCFKAVQLHCILHFMFK